MKSWPTKLLGELCDVEGGNAAPQGDENFKGGTIPFVRMKDLGRYHFTNNLTETDDKLTEDSVITNRMKIFEPGCILFPRSGSVALNHRAILGIRACIVSHIGVLQNLRPEITPGFLYLHLTTFDMTALSKKTTGVDSIAFADVRRIPVPVPPLAEQERLVKLLDETDELRKLRAQADRRTAALISALFHEMFGDPGTNSKGLPVKPFGELVSNQDGRRKPVKASDRAERQGEYPYYGASGIIDYVEKYLFDETALLIAEDGANLLARSTPIAFLAHGKYWVNNHAHIVTDNGNADLNYLCAALNLRDLTDYVTGSAQPKLNQANMNRIPIPVPPPTLQKEFAQRVAEISELEAGQATSRTRLDALFQSMLHRAFNGEL